MTTVYCTGVSVGGVAKSVRQARLSGGGREVNMLKEGARRLEPVSIATGLQGESKQRKIKK